MTWSVVGRGSYFAGAPDPKDLDLVVITSELEDRDATVDRQSVLDRLAPVLAGLPAEDLPVDLHILGRGGELTTWHRAIIHAGPLLAGDDLRPGLPVVSWPEWAAFTAWWWHSEIAGDRPAAALAAIRGLLAPVRGTLALSKYLVPAAAVGTPWRELANAAWSHRGSPHTFDHPDFERAGREVQRLGHSVRHWQAPPTSRRGEAAGVVDEVSP